MKFHEDQALGTQCHSSGPGDIAGCTSTAFRWIESRSLVQTLVGEYYVNTKWILCEYYVNTIDIMNTGSTAQGGGGSFKDRELFWRGELLWCMATMAPWAYWMQQKDPSIHFPSPLYPERSGAACVAAEWNCWAHGESYGLRILWVFGHIRAASVTGEPQ